MGLLASSPKRGNTSVRRALVWAARNSSPGLVARSLRRRGWQVDWLGTREVLDAVMPSDEDAIVLRGPDDLALDRALRELPLDAFLLHGDDQVRALYERRHGLSETVLRHLPPLGSVDVALSKERSAQLAGQLGVPVPRTVRCTDPRDLQAARREVAGDGPAIVKGDGGSAGSRVRLLRPRQMLTPAEWDDLAASAGSVQVQKQLTGPRLFVTVAYERGEERAACGHQKLGVWPHPFGVTAIGVTRFVPEVHESTERMFSTLRWHGLANVEFRQDREDGRWYFMEINPRVNCSLGIQAAAGIDFGEVWAAICEGRGRAEAPGRRYRSGVRYWWAAPMIALALRRPWSARHWMPSLLGAGCDLFELESSARWASVRRGLWLARHA